MTSELLYDPEKCHELYLALNQTRMTLRHQAWNGHACENDNCASAIPLHLLHYITDTQRLWSKAYKDILLRQAMDILGRSFGPVNFHGVWTQVSSGRN